MVDNTAFLLCWRPLSRSVLKSIAFSFFMVMCCGWLPVNGQSSTISEDLKSYQQAVDSKAYQQAAQHAYNIAKRYKETNDLGKSLDYLNEALGHAKKSKNQSLVYSVYHQLGLYSAEAKKYSKALENFQAALTTAQTLKDSILMKAELINVAVSYGQLEKYKKSIEVAENALSIALTKRDTLLQQKCYALLAEFHGKQGNTKKALEYKAQLNLLITAQQNEAVKKRQISELENHILTVGLENQATQAQLAEQHKQLLQTNASLRMTERSLQTTTESLRATTDSLKVIEAISKNRQMEIELLQKDKELADTKIKEQEARIENEALLRNFITVGTVLSVALISVMVISYRKKSKDNKKIQQQNKNIKSSINYAKRIQEAMLPRSEQHPHIFENTFILFKPRDTVSGDFYWFSDIKNESRDGSIAFAAVDCTGHGVPGAFMSMIGINALNGLINRGISEPHTLLIQLDHEIRTALRQEVSGNNDGMDVALCIYRQKEKMLEFAGAKNPLIYIQDSTLFQVKGDIHSIGGKKKMERPSVFKKHEIALNKPTVVYLFSDGYKHQFGGKDNGKFSSKSLNKLLLEIHQLPLEEQKNILQSTIEEWKGNRDQTDDILVMGLKFA